MSFGINKIKEFFKRIVLRFRKTPLRWRVTLLTASVLILACAAITVITVYRAQNMALKIITEEAHKLEPPGDIFFITKRFNNNTVYYRLTSLYIMLGVSAVCVLLTYFATGRALKPIIRLSKDISGREGSNLFTPVITEPANDEVLKLADSFNSLLAKLEEEYGKQKRFAANAAHELKTPLASMIASIDVLKLNPAPSETEYNEVFDVVTENARRLNAIVNDMLEINYERTDCVRSAFKLPPVLDEILAELDFAVKEKNISVKTEAEDISISGERRLIYRALFNIIHNAIRYNVENGEIFISVHKNGENAEILIKDTGIGIPKDDLERIFDPFYCVDKSRSRLSGGNGLGLSIVKTIIDRHGGTVEISSEIGRGTNVRVALRYASER